jgi:hypothetical protein
MNSQGLTTALARLGATAATPKDVIITLIGGQIVQCNAGDYERDDPILTVALTMVDGLRLSGKAGQLSVEAITSVNQAV